MSEIIERYEYKYWVPNSLVPSIRAAVRTTSKIDRYAGPDGTYRIRSLYFDTDKFDLYWANEREQADRLWNEHLGHLRSKCRGMERSPISITNSIRHHAGFVSTTNGKSFH